MAQQQKTQKQPQDRYSQRGKSLVSSVQRLRGWVGSDPSRTPELADALVELTAHRLLGHAYAAAAGDAQEAVRLAAQLLTANGPIGPYTSVTDALRCLTAVVQLATIQAGVGLPDAAGRTLESLRDLQEQLRGLGLEEQLKPQTAIWALSGAARVALASGDAAAANAYADAALARLTESGLDDDADAAYLALDVDRLVSDCRWAAGQPEEALTFLHVAKDRYDKVVAGRLSEPGRLSPALVERLAEPLFGLYRDLADRLAAAGEVDLGLVTRRELVELLHGLAGRLGEAGRGLLASAQVDLAADLLAAGRAVEALAAADQAAAQGADRSVAESIRLLTAAVRARALVGAGRSGEALSALRQVLAQASGTPSAARAVALLAQADALRVEGEPDAASETERAFSDLAEDLLGPAAGGRPTPPSMVLDLARGVVSRGTQRLTWAQLPSTASYAATTAVMAGAGTRAADDVTARAQRETTAWLETERAEAHRRELERLEQARIEVERTEVERVRAERVAAEREAAERAEAERVERLEAERRAAAEEAERLARKRRREERLEAHRLEVERQEAERREAARLEAERQAAERLAADPAEAERRELERLQAELAELERLEEQAQAERLREPLAAEPAAPQDVEEVAVVEPVAESEPPRVKAERIEVERSEAERVEAERVQAERAEAERLEAERAEAARAEAERLEAERAEAERLEAARIEAERLEAERLEPSEPDELDLAQQAYRDAKTAGDRRGTRAASERVVELLRPRAEADPAEYGLQLCRALEELSSARLRSGDVWGSRAPAREAKALARTLGR